MRPVPSQVAAIALGCIVMVAAVPGFARGSALADVFSEIVKVLVSVAILAGLACGVLAARFRIRPRPTVVTLVCVALLVAVFALGAGNYELWMHFILLPAAAALLILLVVFAVISTLAAPSAPDDRQRVLVLPRWARSLCAWAGASYVFWAVFSLLNIGFLAGLAFPPALFAGFDFYRKFMPFVGPPVAFSLVTAGVIAAGLAPALRGPGRRFAPFYFNGILLLAFLISAEIYKSFLISQALKTHQPECVSSRSFFASLLDAGSYFRPPHAVFDEKGGSFYWSYSERRFLEAGEGLKKNISCRPLT